MSLAQSTFENSQSGKSRSKIFVLRNNVGGKLKLKNQKVGISRQPQPKLPLIGKRPQRDASPPPEESKKPFPSLSLTAIALQEQEQLHEMVIQPIEPGLGKLITSGRTVHGFESDFPRQLEIGDFIILMDANGDDDGLKERERRRVNMVLSGKSCGLEEAFSEDVIDKGEYYVQKKPKQKEKARNIEDIVNERIKGGAGDAKRRKDEEVEESREKMLDQRVKKKTDKFCWF